MEIITNIAENTPAIASLASALIAASVALLVVVLNQTFSRRQQRMQFLQPKLEELYLLMNEVSERNTRLFKLLVASIHGDIDAKKEFDAMDELSAYGHLTAKKMVMLVRLYFPRLSRIHQFLFAAERQVGQCMWELSTDNPPSLEAILEASGTVGHMLSLMEQEMVDNQEKLLRVNTLPRRYRAASLRDIENVPPPPEGPPLASMMEQG